MGFGRFRDRTEVRLARRSLPGRPADLAHFAARPEEAHDHLPLSRLLDVEVGRPVVVAVEPQFESRQVEGVDLAHPERMVLPDTSVKRLEMSGSPASAAWLGSRLERAVSLDVKRARCLGDAADEAGRIFDASQRFTLTDADRCLYFEGFFLSAAFSRASSLGVSCWTPSTAPVIASTFAKM